MTATKIATAAILIITPLAVLFILLTGTSRLACEAQAINLALPLSSKRQIWGDNIAIQTFGAAYPNLNRFDIYLQTYFRDNSAPVTIRLIEVTTGSDPLAPGAKVNFETSLDPATLPAQSWQSFSFPAIADSANKRYAIVIAAPQAEPGNAITFGGIENSDPYQPGQATLGGVTFPGDMAFRACFQMSLAEKIAVLARQLTQHRPWLWGSAAFYGGLLLLYGVLVGLLFWKVANIS